MNNKYRIRRYPNGGMIRKYEYGSPYTTQYGQQTPLSTYQYNDNILQNSQGQFNQPLNNNNFESISGGYGNNMTQYNQNQYGGNGGYDQGNFFNGNFGTQQSNNGFYNNINQNAGLYSAGLNVGTQLLQSTDSNQYNQMYGNSGASASGQTAASFGGPVASVGSSALGLIGTGLDQAVGAQEYNQYGYNTSGEGALSKGSIYTAGKGGLDQMGQLTTDAEQGNWDNVVIDLLGGSTYTSLLNYKNDQAEAEKRTADAQKAEALRKRQLRNETTSNITYQPTLTYPNGGIIEDPTMTIISGYDSNKNPIYSKVPNTTWNSASFTPNEKRVGTVGTTKNIAMSQFNISANEFNQGYKKNPQSYTDSLASLYPYKYKSEINSLGNPTLSEYIPNKNKKITFSQGGLVQEANAELETKEVFRTPDGSIEKVPEGTPGHQKGGIKLNLPEGTEILGKMKGKYNDKSYKDMGQDLKKRYDKYEKAVNESSSPLHKRTAQRMLDKIQMEFDSLMEDQQIQTGITNYQKKYAKGGVTDTEEPLNSTYNDTVNSKYNFLNQLSTEERQKAFDAYSKYMNDPNSEWKPKTDYLYGKDINDIFDPFINKNYDQFHDITSMSKERQSELATAANGRDKLYGTQDAFYQFYHGPYKQINNNASTVESDKISPSADLSIINNQSQKIKNDPITQPTLETINNDAIFTNRSDFNPNDLQYQYNIKGQQNINNTAPWWENTLGASAQLAPAVYNMYQGLFGKVDKLNSNDYNNPYEGKIIASLRDRKYNIKPQLDMNELAYQTGRRNVRQVAPGVGNLLSNYNALAGTRMRADGQAWAQKQNVEGQWKGQDASILAQLGDKRAQTKFNIDQYNAASEAAKRQSLSTGLSQLGQSAYNWNSSRNAQRNQDKFYNAIESNMSNYQFDQYGNIIYK